MTAPDPRDRDNIYSFCELVAVLVILAIICWIIAHPIDAHGQDEEIKLPTAFSIADLTQPPTSPMHSACDAREERLQSKAGLGRALLDRYFQPFEDWANPFDPSLTIAHPAHADKTTWYAIIITPENKFLGERIYFKFSISFRPKEEYESKDSWDWTLMWDIRHHMKDEIKEAFGRYLEQIESRHLYAYDNESGSQYDERMKGYQLTLRTGKARFYELPSEDFDASKVIPAMEIK